MVWPSSASFASVSPPHQCLPTPDLALAGSLSLLFLCPLQNNTPCMLQNPFLERWNWWLCHTFRPSACHGLPFKILTLICWKKQLNILILSQQTILLLGLTSCCNSPTTIPANAPKANILHISKNMIEYSGVCMFIFLLSAGRKHMQREWRHFFTPTCTIVLEMIGWAGLRIHYSRARVESLMAHRPSADSWGSARDSEETELYRIFLHIFGNLGLLPTRPPARGVIRISPLLEKGLTYAKSPHAMKEVMHSSQQQLVCKLLI